MTQLVAAQDVRTPATFIEWMARWQKQVPEALDRAVAELDKRLHGQKNRVMVSPGKAGGFNCEPLKAALDVAATRPLGPPYGWLR